MSNADDMDHPLTKREFRATIDTELVTKREFHEVMKNLFGYLDERFAAVTKTIQVEIRRATKGIEQRNRDDMTVIDEKYKDLPDRVTKLEAVAFPPPKRQRRS